VYFAQEKDGIPVFRGEVRLLTRNEPGFPVVLVTSMRGIWATLSSIAA
jgi:hypothetical protein